MIGWIRRLQRLACGETGVPTWDTGGDWRSGGKASSSGVKHMGTLVGAKSAAIVEGVLVTEWKLLLVRHAFNARGSNGPGESKEVTDMLSNSGVPGSRYGLVVLMNVTGQY